MSELEPTGQSERVGVEESAANDLREALRAAGISTLVRGGPDVFAESRFSWVVLGHLKEVEAATLAALIRKGLDR
ncbi:hypothetical protein OG618_17665 [Kitasatospora sp. NBC_01246]|uniref:hypothetical protein n=1 Tax=Kitasatospora sp. NBC_01246 TaxID=2903570 RepID=UPI002E3373D7|nr:hypothetical protein [Kitasatospora sp. NBC_01246]